MTIASRTHRVRPAGRRYERTEESGRSFSSESCATRRKKSGRRLPTRRICASGRPLTRMEPGCGWNGEAHYRRSARGARPPGPPGGPPRGARRPTCLSGSPTYGGVYD
jgi:hypothetical protein